MNKTASSLTLALLFLCGAAAYAQSEGNRTKAALPEVKIPFTQQLSITSSITHEKYDIYVNLPADYQKVKGPFPVMYLLDAQWDFPLAGAIYGQQYYDGFIPGMVIVGITWSGPNANYDSLRAGDFTPTSLKQAPFTGKGPLFLQFIKKELIPLIESRYRVKKGDRTLMGSSLGGLFTLYAMFEAPGLFNRFVLTSPYIPWDNGVLYSFEKKYAAEHKDLHARVFMGIGEYEDPTAFKDFVDTLESRHYEGLSLESKILHGVGHSGTKSLGFSWGLQYVFKRPSLELSHAVLEQYAGTYRTPRGGQMSLTVEGDSLVLRDLDGSMWTLHAETPGNFYVVGKFLRLDVKRDKDGKVTEFDVKRYRGNSTAMRVSS